MTRVLAALLVASIGVSTDAGSPQGTVGVPEGTRHTYFTALDKKGNPVADLAAADVRVREDGVDRQVVRVEPATAPLHVALLVDDSGPGLRFIREGTGAFIQRLGGRAEMSLTSTGAKNTLLVDFTPHVNELYDGVRRLVTRNTGNAVDGGYLLDAVHDAIEALRTRGPERPAIVIVMLEGAEFSSRRADRLLSELQGSRAVLHVVALGKPTLKTMSGWNEGPMQSLRENLDENINRRKFLEDGARQSGGRFEQVLVDSGVPSALNAVAQELASQYVVVYSRPGEGSPRKINITSTRGGVKVRARTDMPAVSGVK
jgi:VWFA-related protein